MGKRLRKLCITVVISREETLSDTISDCDPRNAVFLVAIASSQIQKRWDLCYWQSDKWSSDPSIIAQDPDAT